MTSDDDLAGVACSRCGRLAPITAAQLRDTSGGDPSLPIVTPVPEAWTPLAELDGMDGEDHEEQVAAVEFDPDLLACPQCVLPHERDAWFDALDGRLGVADPATAVLVLGVWPDDEPDADD